MSKAQISRAKAKLKEEMKAEIERLEASQTSQVKRSTNNFMFYVADMQAQVKLTMPGAKASAVSAKIGEMWRVLPEESKAVYQEKAKQDKARFAAEIELEKKQNGGKSLMLASQVKDKVQRAREDFDKKVSALTG